MPTPAAIAAYVTELDHRDVPALARFLDESGEDSEAAAALLVTSSGMVDEAGRLQQVPLEATAAAMLLMAAQNLLRRQEPASAPEPARRRSHEDGYQALASHDTNRALEIGDELIGQAEELDDYGWGAYGDLVHLGHIIRGYALLEREDLAGAAAELRAAGDTPGSKVLASFGPDIRLAWELLRRGQDEAVLDYFHDVAQFWSTLGPAQIAGL